MSSYDFQPLDLMDYLGDEELSEDMFNALSGVFSDAGSRFLLTEESEENELDEDGWPVYKEEEPPEYDEDALNDYQNGAAMYAFSFDEDTKSEPEAKAKKILEEMAHEMAKAEAEAATARWNLYGAAVMAYEELTPTEIIRATGLARQTVYKVLDADRLV
ncbi:MAG: hypothetical protein E6180_01710 [Varibaculum cambriense]|nr:hypothetical protein [Varibaculum cambriense]